MIMLQSAVATLVLKVQGHSFEIQAGQTFTLGRHRTNQLVLKDSQASRFHARISWREGSPLLEDLGSTNGTFLDGRRLQGPTALRPNQRVLIGSFRMEFDMVEAAAPPLLPPSGDLEAFDAWMAQEFSGRFTRRLTLQRLLLDLEADAKTGRLEFTFGVRKATLNFELGQIVGASHLEQRGREAVAAILRASIGDYRFVPEFGEPERGDLDLSVRELLCGRSAAPTTDRVKR